MMRGRRQCRWGHGYAIKRDLFSLPRDQGRYAQFCNVLTADSRYYSSHVLFLGRAIAFHVLAVVVQFVVKFIVNPQNIFFQSTRCVDKMSRMKNSVIQAALE